jgi:pyocin large subunit-like protein
MWNVMGRTVAAAASSAALLALGACDGGASAVAARDHSPLTDVTGGSQPAAYAQSGYTQAPAPRAAYARPGDTATGVDPRTLPVRLVQGKPAWAATKTLSADDAAQANFEKNGADFGARSVRAWVGQVHDFVDSPPRGVERIVRANGDVLLYDAKANVFAVATKDGAPRTMFKPTTGAAYWDQQKAENAPSGRTTNRRAAQQS